MSSPRSDLCWLLTVSQHQAHSFLFCDAVAGLLKTTLPRLPPAGFLLRSAGWWGPAEGDWKVKEEKGLLPSSTSQQQTLKSSTDHFYTYVLRSSSTSCLESNPPPTHTHIKNPRAGPMGLLPPGTWLASKMTPSVSSCPHIHGLAWPPLTLNQIWSMRPMEYGESEAV